MDVASQIDPTTVHLKSLTDPTAVRILEQNYEYDLLNAQWGGAMTRPLQKKDTTYHAKDYRKQHHPRIALW
jgi:hypothetical protein